MDKDHVSGLVFGDNKKAFDLIDCNILLRFETYGAGTKELRLLEHYKKDRRQLAVIDGVQSEYRLITYGGPHGSVLGPLLSIIFVNDLPHSVFLSIVHVYADHTTLSTSPVVSNLPVIQQQLQDNISKIADWTSEHRMVLNTSKTRLVTGKRVARRFPDKLLKNFMQRQQI